MGPRRFWTTLLLTLLAVALLPPSSAAAADYRQVLDIRFPTVSSGSYSDDFANARSGGRRHRATDIFAAAGSPVYAARGGRVVWMPTYEYPGSGYSLWIRDNRGHTFAYYHLGPAGGSVRSAVAPGISTGSWVRRGQRIGWLGDSGNAAGGSPHLHFEIHDYGVRDPYGSGRLNPYASLRASQGRTAPSASRSAVRSTGLRLGARGPAVVRWQRQLNRAIAAGLATDGSFGPMTSAATIRFQRAAGLGPSGLGTVGPRTRAAMARRLGAAQPRRTAAAGALRYGSNGAAVVTWQGQLNRAIRAGLVTDGAFGPATRAATVRFQRSAGLSGSGLGIVGPRTRAAMQRRLHNAAPRRDSVPVTTQLRYGSRGAAVVTWQRQLNRAARAGLIADGVFGPATRAATVRFQRSAGLGPAGLGIVGPRTRAAMARRL